MRRAVYRRACPRCRGALYWDYDGDAACIVCGYRDLRRLPHAPPDLEQYLRRRAVTGRKVPLKEEGS